MKIAVVGAGLGGCITGMYYGLYNTVDSDVEVTIYHDPDVPIERVGQGTTTDVLGLIYVALNNGWDLRFLGLAYSEMTGTLNELEAQK